MPCKALSKRKPNNDSIFFFTHLCAHHHWSSSAKCSKYFCVGINAYFRLVRAIVFVSLLEKIWWCDKYIYYSSLFWTDWLMKGEEHFRCVYEPDRVILRWQRRKREKETFATRWDDFGMQWIGKHESISRALFKCYCEFYFHKTHLNGAARACTVFLWTMLLLPSATLCVIIASSAFIHFQSVQSC